MRLELVGVFFLLFSGIFFTAERIAEVLAAGMRRSGEVNYPNFFDNFFVWLFFAIGILLIANKFLLKVWKNYHSFVSLGNSNTKS